MSFEEAMKKAVNTDLSNNSPKNKAIPNDKH